MNPYSALVPQIPPGLTYADLGITPGMTVTPVGQPYQPLAPTTPQVGAPPSYQFTDPYSSQQFLDAIQNSPLYKQQMEWIQQAEQKAKDDLAFGAEWNKKFYEQNRSQIAGSMPSFGAGEAQYAQLLALQKEAAAHDYANQQEYIREALGSRGLASSGQVPLELSEAKFDFENFNKELDLREQARKAEQAQAQANAQRSISNQLADLDLRNQYQLAQDQKAAADLAREIAARKGDALLTVADKLMPFYFDAQTGAYIGPGGQVLTPAQAQATIAPAPQAGPPPVSPYAGIMTSTPQPALPPAPTYVQAAPGRSIAL